jgi:uncharacterized repeat protein (TIGR01451 family)
MPIFIFIGTVFVGLLSCVRLACSASTADLRIEMQAPPWDRPQPLGQRLTYTILLSNAGPDTATQVVVSNRVPEQLSDPGITVSQGTWTLTDRSLRCQLGDLISGSTAAIVVETTPTAVGGIFLEAAATSSNFEPTWPNLTYAQFELGLAQVEVRVDAQTNRVLAGVPFVLTVTVTILVQTQPKTFLSTVRVWQPNAARCTSAVIGRISWARAIPCPRGTSSNFIPMGFPGT